MTLYFIDARNVIVNGGPDVIKRHEVYASKYNHLPGKSRSQVLVASRTSHSRIVSSNFVLKGYSKNFLIYFLRIYDEIQSKPSTCISLVAGDPWLSGLTAITLQRLLRMRRVSTKVQIQVHADICDYEWIKLSWKNRFKSAIAIRILAYTDSIRFVSTSQKRLVHEKQNRKPREEIVIPVFLNLGSRDVEQSWERPRVIGFVGRMEKERGTRSLIQLVEKLSTDSRQNFQVTLIGSGREEISTRDRLEQLLGPDNVRALGQISAEQLIHEWENIGVLVNLAPSESYGRSMREAAASGVPVWSVPSNGFMEFKYKFNQRWIRELKLNDSAEILQKTFDMLLSSKTTGEIREALLSEQEYFLDELVKSWVCNDSE